MSPVPEIMLGVLALLILLGFFAGPSTKSNVHPDTKFGTGQAARANDAEQQDINNAVGNTRLVGMIGEENQVCGNRGQVISMPGASSETQASQPKKS